MNTMNALYGTIVQSMDQLTADVGHWKREASQPGASPLPRQAAPPTPQSWSGPCYAGQRPNEGDSTSMSGGTTTQGFGTDAFANNYGAQPTTAPTQTAFGNQQVPNSNGPHNSSFNNVGNMSGPNLTGTTTYHNMSSPNGQWSPAFGGQTQDNQQPADWGRTNQNAQFGQWAPGAGTELRQFDSKDWSVEGKTASKECIHRVHDHFHSLSQ